jgi:hypothetical protein
MMASGDLNAAAEQLKNEANKLFSSTNEISVFFLT